MASVNQLTRELVFKVVFYGPGLGGKTTTLQYIHAATKPEHRGKMVSLATPTDRTLYFDFLPVRVPRVRGLSVRLQLFTVPGQVYYEATRKLVLTGVDGVVFVADSQAGRDRENRESLEDLVANLKSHDRLLSEVPHTFHWNKRDLDEVVATDELDRRYNVHGVPSIGTVATRGEGVFEGLERIVRLVMRAHEHDAPRESAEQSVNEAGITDAMRELQAAPPSRRTPERGMQAVDPLAVRSSPPPMSRREGASMEPPPTKAADPSLVQASLLPSSVEAEVPAGPWSSTLSFAALWPEGEREAVRAVETRLAGGDLAGAVLGCEHLVARTLASAAALAGGADAPRDPALAVLLLGLDGARYLGFRAAVRAARQQEPLGLRHALDCFAFAIEARRAREAVRA
jgi:signal recognition particle receptor subunit beta